MNRLARWMIRLYPASWRARYGDELDALISDTGADARIVGDLARGGMRMQMKSWPFALLAVVMGLAGFVAGAGISFLIPRVYESRATLRLEGSPGRAAAIEDIGRLTNPLFSRASLAAIINRLGLYRHEQRVEPLVDVIDEMRRAILIDFASPPGHADMVAFNIRFDYGDAQKAQQTVAALVAGLQAKALQAAKEVAEHRPKKMWVVDIPNLPVRPVSPTERTVALAGILSGLLFAVILRAIFRRGWIRRRFIAVAVAMGIAGIILSQLAEAVNRDPNVHLWTNHYRSTATFVLPASQQSEVNAITDEILSRKSLAGIVQNPRLGIYSREQATTPLEDVVQRMKDGISVTPHTNGDETFVSVTFDYYDRYKAQLTVQALLSKYAEIAAARLGTSVETTPAPVIEVLDQPNAPINPVKPN
ncbi:MAG TPA: hypothetical protein VHB50_11130, partial [Bryobacteraceae bacterium]|nr:hypothetical protein [Bryobacteraceae bacterium]